MGNEPRALLVSASLNTASSFCTAPISRKINSNVQTNNFADKKCRHLMENGNMFAELKCCFLVCTNVTEYFQRDMILEIFPLPPLFRIYVKDDWLIRRLLAVGAEPKTSFSFFMGDLSLYSRDFIFFLLPFLPIYLYLSNFQGSLTQESKLFCF